MIIGIGNDLININRIENTLSKFGDRFIKRVFTDIEIKKSEGRLKKYLEILYPELKKHFLQDILRFAVNQEYVSENLNLKPIDEIAIFPPVSGG